MEDIFNNVESPGAYYPQDYSLKTLNFLTANGNRIELKRLMLELSYYEDIYSFSVSGYITIVDAQGFIEMLQLTGNEYIEINFGKVKGAKNETDQTYRVYKIGNRLPAGNQNSETYTLYFCSEELLLSEQIKISRSYKGQKISSIVKDVLTDKLKIKTNKINSLEETTGVYDFIVPRLKPFETISWLSNYARPKGSAGADMLFFETKDGYNFKSLQSMFSDSPYATYKYQAKNIDERQSFQEKATAVLNYEIIKPYDSLNEINSGALANQLVSIDPLTRTYNITNFDYSKYKDEAKSLNGNKVSNNLKNRVGKTPNENYEGVMKVVVGNSGQQNVPYIKDREGSVAKDIFVETYIPNRTAQMALANYTIVKMTIPGDPGITAGRTIVFNLPTIKPTTNSRDLDKFYSGKYLVTAVRHIILVNGIYQTVLELSKDSSPTKYSNVDNSNSTWTEVVNE